MFNPNHKVVCYVSQSKCYYLKMQQKSFKYKHYYGIKSICKHFSNYIYKNSKIQNVKIVSLKFCTSLGQIIFVHNL